MKGLLSTTASRAWMGVVVVGVVVVALVVALQLIPRMNAGQEVIDAAKPATSDAAVEGLVGGTSVLSQYVDLADPLMTRKGESNRELRRLVTMIKRKTGVSAERARAVLRREAPHTEALLRAAPFSGVAAERSRLTRVPLDDAEHHARGAAGRARAELPADLPDAVGAAGRHERLVRRPRRRDPHALRRQAGQDDAPGARLPARRRRRDRRRAAGPASEPRRIRRGRLRSPCCCSILGVGLIVFGLVHARWSASHPSGRVAWGAVAAVGVLVMARRRGAAALPAADRGRHGDRRARAGVRRRSASSACAPAPTSSCRPCASATRS